MIESLNNACMYEIFFNDLSKNKNKTKIGFIIAFSFALVSYERRVYESEDDIIKL